MSSYSYKTHLNVLHGPLEVIDVQALTDACKDAWYNQTLCRVNDSVVRLGVVQGEYHWHAHQDLDEFFYVVEGRFLIDLEAEPAGGGGPGGVAGAAGALGAAAAAEGARAGMGAVRTIDLGPRQGFVVPRGVRHRPRALERTVILMVEGAGIVPTGD